MPSIKIGFLEILRSSSSSKIKIIKLIDYLGGSLIGLFLPERKSSTTITIEQIQRMLIIRPGGIGDAILLLPVLREIKNSYPHIKTDILCERRNQAVFLEQKDTSHQIYCYDNSKEFSCLRNNKYAIIVDTEQWHYLSALVAYFLKPTITVGFASRPLRSKLFDQKIPYEIDTYELQNFKKLFDSLFPHPLTVTDLEGAFSISSEMLEWAHAKIPSQSISLYLGGSLPEKKLSRAQISEIIQCIINHQTTAILLGGKDIIEESADLEKTFSNKQLMNLVGKTSLSQGAAIIKKSKLFIGTDSGLTHLSAAVGTPTIAIFGPSNTRKWGPQGKKHTIVTENVPCAPCSQFSYSIPTCGGKYQCMTQINMQALKELINNQLTHF